MMLIQFERDNLTFNAMYNQDKFETDFIASYLCDNINTALTGLINSNFNISDKSIISSVSEFTFEGRLELINEEKPLLLDCASNKFSANSLKNNIKEFDNIGDLIFRGIKKNEGWKEVIDELHPLFDEIYVPKTPNNDNLKEANKICNYIECNKIESIEEAISNSNPEKTTVITVSLHFISEVNHIIR